jgi:hypothetical protein
MKVGTIVECVNGMFKPSAYRSCKFLPKDGNCYTIRGILEIPGQGLGVYLEEIVNPEIRAKFNGVEIQMEPLFYIGRFREVKEIDELVQELLEETIYEHA